jgi:peptide deformylase
VTILPIVRIGDPVLRLRAAEVPSEMIASDEIQRLIDDMIETMRAAPGVGLAAPQVGEASRIIVVEDPPLAIERLDETQRRERQRLGPFALQAFVNPRIRATENGAKTVFPEGCLSIPGYAGLVERALDIEIAYIDRQGLFHDWMPVHGWPARIIQHEMDHLDGVLYTDKVLPRSLMTDENMKRRTEGRLVTALIEELAGEGKP